jgi:aspartate/tyrosine/aromatic aminotransferase
MPPDHGAAIAAKIFADAAYRQEWVHELDSMRTRIQEMRALLADRLQSATGGAAFDFIRTQRGMFSLLGVPPQAVDVLRDEHHIYMTQDSRMNLAGIMPHNVDTVAKAIASLSG